MEVDNDQVHKNPVHIQAGYRRNKAAIPAPLRECLTGMFGTSEAEELFEQKFGEKQVILFGESKPLSTVSQSQLGMEGLVCTAPLGLLDRRGNRIIVKVKGCGF